jgi:hypothetical protein
MVTELPGSCLQHVRTRQAQISGVLRHSDGRPAGRPPSLYKQTKISLHSHTPTGDCASKASTQVEETSTPPVLQTFQPICRARYHRRPWPPPRDPAPSAASPPPTSWRPRTCSASCACNASAGQPRAASTPSPRRRTTTSPPPARPADTQAAAQAPSTLREVPDRTHICRCNTRTPVRALCN